MFSVPVPSPSDSTTTVVPVRAYELIFPGDVTCGYINFSLGRAWLFVVSSQSSTSFLPTFTVVVHYSIIVQYNNYCSTTDSVLVSKSRTDARLPQIKIGDENTVTRLGNPSTPVWEWGTGCSQPEWEVSLRLAVALACVLLSLGVAMTLQSTVTGATAAISAGPQVWRRLFGVYLSTRVAQASLGGIAE